jgi:hypothetical protein
VSAFFFFDILGILMYLHFTFCSIKFLLLFFVIFILLSTDRVTGRPRLVYRIIIHRIVITIITFSRFILRSFIIFCEMIKYLFHGCLFDCVLLNTQFIFYFLEELKQLAYSGIFLNIQTDEGLNAFQYLHISSL